MQLQDVDPRDEACFAEWFAVARAVELHDRPGEPGWGLQEQRAQALEGARPGADVVHELVAVRDDGRVVAAGLLELPQRDNLHLAEALVMVAPDRRRRGLGRRLSGELERRVREHGRDTLMTFADEPPGTQGRSAGRLAALALGWRLGQTEIRRDIDLPLQPDRVAALQRSCGPHAAGYDVRTWWDRCPDDLVTDRAALSGHFSADVPKDELDWREEVWDAGRVRRSEARVAAMDRTFVGVGALHRSTGRLVAFTEMGLPRADRRRAYQWETVVAAEHRGRRLGILVKLAGLQELARASPATGFISTWNAQENAPMIAVNDALGARVNGQLAVLQRRLT